MFYSELLKCLPFNPSSKHIYIYDFNDYYFMYVLYFDNCVFYCTIFMCSWYFYVWYIRNISILLIFHMLLSCPITAIVNYIFISGSGSIFIVIRIVICAIFFMLTVYVMFVAWYSYIIVHIIYILAVVTNTIPWFNYIPYYNIEVITLTLIMPN